jgi:3-deoxy-D-arabino-heptulosonate 7-phosphate (DAHP) synthase
MLMSHFTRMRTTLRDERVLASALRELGFAAVEIHDTAQPLHDYWGGPGADCAEVVIRKKDARGASADIGFARQSDGSFAIVLDAMDTGRYGREWLAQLTQAYGHAAALEYARTHGYEVVTDEAEQDGTRRLTLRRVS